jgi:hypothetical protein
MEILRFLDTFPPAYIDLNASYSYIMMQIIYDIERRNPFFVGINILSSYSKYYNNGYLEHSISLRNSLIRNDIYNIFNKALIKVIQLAVG